MPDNIRGEKKHDLTTSVMFLGIEKIKPSLGENNFVNQLLKRDALWIYKVHTVEPHRLKIRFQSFCVRGIIVLLYHVRL